MKSDFRHCLMLKTKLISRTWSILLFIYYFCKKNKIKYSLSMLISSLAYLPDTIDTFCHQFILSLVSRGLGGFFKVILVQMCSWNCENTPMHILLSNETWIYLLYMTIGSVFFFGTRTFVYKLKNNRKS
jgi:hypothetical protein